MIGLCGEWKQAERKFVLWPKLFHFSNFPQLLNEKKTLNEKVSSLVEELKSGEERYQRNLKAIEERHAIEIQRVKETQAAAEKLKREKWIDTKTQKIKVGLGINP